MNGFYCSYLFCLGPPGVIPADSLAIERNLVEVRLKAERTYPMCELLTLSFSRKRKAEAHPKKKGDTSRLSPSNINATNAVLTDESTLRTNNGQYCVMMMKLSEVSCSPKEKIRKIFKQKS